MTPAPVTALGDLPEGGAAYGCRPTASAAVARNYSQLHARQIRLVQQQPKHCHSKRLRRSQRSRARYGNHYRQSARGGATTSCTVAVKQLIDGFVGYGQEHNGQCWAALY